MSVMSSEYVTKPATVKRTVKCMRCGWGEEYEYEAQGGMMVHDACPYCNALSYEFNSIIDAKRAAGVTHEELMTMVQALR